MRLTAGATTMDIRLAPGTTLGVQVTRPFVPGVDPRTTPSPIVSEFVSPAGNVVWLDRSGERPIPAPAQWRIAADGTVSMPEPLSAVPEWIERDPIIKRTETEAAPVIDVALSLDRPVDDQLLELYLDARRMEVKSLAARSSIHVGMFVPFVEALRDSKQRSNWRYHIDALRAAMALSPESAAKVWETLDKQRGSRAAADLYEMLCGYAPQQVGLTKEERQSQTGPLARLIGWLEGDNQLDYRVLAVENLADITGKRILNNPAGSPTERGNAIRIWKQRLANDEVVPERAQ
jgi:hypothetical protein